jgi:hypothetical protein
MCMRVWREWLQRCRSSSELVVRWRRRHEQQACALREALLIMLLALLAHQHRRGGTEAMRHG